MKKEIIVGIYKITSPSGKVNIGQTWNINKRWNNYKCLSCKGQIKLYNSLKFYGPENHTFEIQEILSNDCTQEQLDEREIYWIEFYKNQGCDMMNLREGGTGGQMPEEIKKRWSQQRKGVKISEERKIKMLGRVIPEEVRKKLSESHKGKKHSEESKLKMSRVQKELHLSGNKKKRINYFHSEQTRTKISTSNKGKKMSDEARLKISTAKKGKKTKPRSEETKVKISNTLKGHSVSEQTRKKIKETTSGRTRDGIIILQYDMERNFIKEWKKLTDIYIDGISASQTIRKCLKGLRNSYKGYIWKRKN